jgi:hypothetical protein
MMRTLAGIIVAFGAGLYVGVARPWPIAPIKQLLAPYMTAGATDRFGRLLRYPGKIEVSCPVQDASTAVLLIIGQ